VFLSLLVHTLVYISYILGHKLCGGVTLTLSSIMLYDI